MPWSLHIEPTSKRTYIDVVEDLTRRGALGVILGCTEIGLLMDREDCSIPVIDTTQIHADAAVATALGKFRESSRT